MTDAPLHLLPAPDFWEQELAQPRGPQYLTFDLGQATFCLPLTSVREVDRLPPVTPVPHVPAWVLGLVNLRGEVLSAVDLATFLGLDAPRPGRDARILSCRSGGMEAGLVIDAIKDIRELSDDGLRPPVGPVAGRIARYLRGVHVADGRLSLILDVARLLQAPEFRRFV